MVYTAGTCGGSSGAPIIKVDGKKLLVVGLHREGVEKEKDNSTKGYNCGSTFLQIIKSIHDEDWHLQLTGD